MTLTTSPSTRPSSSTRTTSFDLRSAHRHRGRWGPLPVWTGVRGDVDASGFRRSVTSLALRRRSARAATGSHRAGCSSVISRAHVAAGTRVGPAVVAQRCTRRRSALSVACCTARPRCDRR